MRIAHKYDGFLRCASQFTGKERDTETGLDYFGARYYGSNMGRWMSPDWSASPEPVPYAKLDNPQSLNLYGYVFNNPATNLDPDGHICIFGIGNTCGGKTPPPLPPTPDPARVRQAPKVKGRQVQPRQDQRVTPHNRAINITSGVANLASAGVKGYSIYKSVQSGQALAAPGVVSYESLQVVVGAFAGGTQIAAGFANNKTSEQALIQSGDAASLVLSGAGMTTLLTTGDLNLAAKAAAFEGMFTTSVTREVFKDASTVIDTVLNIKTAAEPSDSKEPI